MQDDTYSGFSQFASTPAASSKNSDTSSPTPSSITPPEAWGGERLSDKLNQLRQSVNVPSRFAALTSSNLTSGSMLSGLQDVTFPTSQSTSLLTSSSLSLANMRVRETSNQEASYGSSENVSTISSSLSLSTRGSTGQANVDYVGPSLGLPRRFSSYAERISTAPSFADGTSLSVGSPKTKKTGAETREELLSSWLARSDKPSTTAEAGVLPTMNVWTMISLF